MASHWYVLSCALRKEQLIYRRLLDLGYEVFFPSMQLRRRGQIDSRLQPYFPGYLFVYVDLSKTALSTFQSMPMTGGLVCLGTKPAYVPEQVIQAIQRNLIPNSKLKDEPLSGHTHPLSKNPADFTPPDGKILDIHAPSSERIRELFKMLRGMENSFGVEISASRDLSSE